MTETLLITQSEIKELVDMKKAIELIDQTFIDMGAGKTINPTKLTLDLGESAPFPAYDGFVNAMPAYIGWQDVAGIKWVSGIGGKRREAGLPFINGMIILMDPQMGEFISVMDGQHITNLRTGGQTAVAIKNIFKGRKSLKVGLYGAGTQGRTQIMAISEIFDIEKLVIYDVYEAASKKYKEDMASYVTGEIVIAETQEEVAKDVDAIITVTQANDGFLKAEWIEEGTVVFPMGSYKEIEDDVILQADHIIVDHVEQALHRGALKELNEQGKILEKDLSATISELAAGVQEIEDVGSKRIVCIPIGTGAVDITVAKYIYDEAIKRDMGTRFEFN